MSERIQSYQDLIVWQKSMRLVDEVYKISRVLPKVEMYVLTPQILRAVISIPSNIAEGFRRKSRAEYMHYLTISLGSAAELETQLLIIKKQYTEVVLNDSFTLLEEVQRMLNTMTASYKS
ncbi:MAG: four helix bundle protein [Candidatus Doudnabacteria bacterium]|nr:four helix bundle protein [Candidatus Doudnabacteria bacterium]